MNIFMNYRLSDIHSGIFLSGELAHALRFLASVVSQSFLAFGDILELHKKFLELSGGINRIFELEELLDASQSGKSHLIIISVHCSPLHLYSPSPTTHTGAK